MKITPIYAMMALTGNKPVEVIIQEKATILYETLINYYQQSYREIMIFLNLGDWKHNINFYNKVFKL